jgi:hypothetical protein
MRNTRSGMLPVLWLTSLAACASARPVFVIRPVNDGALNAQWPEVLRTRYECEGAVVGAALQAVRAGHTYPSRMPIASDQGKLVCDVVGEMWPVRVRAFATDSGIVEQWEFQWGPQQGGHPATTTNIYGSNPDPGRPAISRNSYQTGSVSFQGPTPHLLRLVYFR